MTLRFTNVEELRIRRKQLRRAATRRRRPRARRPNLPRSAELQYVQVVGNIVNFMNEQIQKRIIPLLEKPTGAEMGVREGVIAAEEKLDAIVGTIRRELDRLLVELGVKISDPKMLAELAEVGSLTSSANAREVGRVLGIDILAADPAAAAALAGFLQKNIALITKMTTEQMRKVERIIDEGATSGTPSAQIAEKLVEQGIVGEKRAKLIARDQVLTLNADLTRTRHQALGITHYFWSSSNDSKVRGSEPSDSQDHKSLDGKRFAYADPPADPRDGVRAHPGERINCRCIQIPDTDPLLDLGADI